MQTQFTRAQIVASLADQIEACNMYFRRRRDIEEELQGFCPAEIAGEYAYARSKTRGKAEQVYRVAVLENGGEDGGVYEIPACESRTGVAERFFIRRAAADAGVVLRHESAWQSLFPTFRRRGRALSALMRFKDFFIMTSIS